MRIFLNTDRSQVYRQPCSLAAPRAHSSQMEWPSMAPASTLHEQAFSVGFLYVCIVSGTFGIEIRANGI